MKLGELLDCSLLEGRRAFWGGINTSLWVLYPLLHICFWPLQRGYQGTDCGAAPGCLSSTERSKQAFSGYSPFSGAECSKLILIKKWCVPKISCLSHARNSTKKHMKQIPYLKFLAKEHMANSVLNWRTEVLVSSFSAGISYILCAPRWQW